MNPLRRKGDATAARRELVLALLVGAMTGWRARWAVALCIRAMAVIRLPAFPQ